VGLGSDDAIVRLLARSLLKVGAAWLAWRQLAREKLRLFVALAGVAFAVVLMFMQLGFRTALFESAVRFHSHLQGQLFLISPRSSFLAQMQSFTWRRLYQAAGYPEVESVTWAYTNGALCKNPYDGSTHRLFVIGIDVDKPALDLPGLQANLNALRLPDKVLFDADSRPDYGPIVEHLRAGETIKTEVENHEVTVAGAFNLGTSFGIDATLITSDVNFLRLFPSHQEGLIHVGIIRLQPGTDAVALRDRMTATLPRDVEVLTMDGFKQREVDYWASATPIGYVFTFGAIMGFVVGMVIVYQILFADVSDHLAEYATLKAMGYRDGYLFRVVLCQAVVLAVLGFLPGLAASRGLYQLTNQATHLPMTLGVPVGSAVLTLTIVMCGISGMIAVRRIRSADPAEIF
jgi:heterocyst specific transport system permease protein